MGWNFKDGGQDVGVSVSCGVCVRDGVVSFYLSYLRILDKFSRCSDLKISHDLLLRRFTVVSRPNCCVLWSFRPQVVSPLVGLYILPDIHQFQQTEIFKGKCSYQSETTRVRFVAKWPGAKWPWCKVTRSRLGWLILYSSCCKPFSLQAPYNDCIRQTFIPRDYPSYFPHPLGLQRSIWGNIAGNFFFSPKSESGSWLLILNWDCSWKRPKVELLDFNTGQVFLDVLIWNT